VCLASWSLSGLTPCFAAFLRSRSHVQLKLRSSQVVPDGERKTYPGSLHPPLVMWRHPSQSPPVGAGFEFARVGENPALFRVNCHTARYRSF
jgi:hypothetical protein